LIPRRASALQERAELKLRAGWKPTLPVAYPPTLTLKML
jgi:hypothetical protein